jgi:hypothetical protein
MRGLTHEGGGGRGGGDLIRWHVNKYVINE